MKKTILMLITVIIVAAAVYIYLKQTGSLPANNQPSQDNQTKDQADNQSQLENYKNVQTPPSGQSEITPEQFVKSYLDAYKNIAIKKNFAEVKSFLTSDALAFMQSEGVPLETNYTQFDGYEILSVQNAGNHYVAKVKLSSSGELLKESDGSDTTEIDFIRQGVNWKAETWYFAQ
jgi:hypothetical protein